MLTQHRKEKDSAAVGLILRELLQKVSDELHRWPDMQGPLLQEIDAALEVNTIAYIVTDGDYSSYGIYAVFSTRTEAENYIRVCRDGHGTAQVEEWEIDSEVGKIPRRLYRTQVNRLQIEYEVEVDAVDHPLKRTPDNPITVPPGFDGFWAESYVSAEHAHKLAVEEIQRRLRDKP